jgi:protein TonB
MFNQLLESKAKKQKMAGGTVFSIVFHTVLIGAAVYATARAGVKDEKAKSEKIQFVEMKKEPPKVPDKPPPPKEVVVKPPPPKGFQVLRAPVRIDIKIPEMLLRAITNETTSAERCGRYWQRCRRWNANTNQTYFEFQVEKPAESLP